MDNREAIGSWLSGPRAAAEEMGADFGHRGKRLGLPEDGPGAIAPVGRRVGALFIDWALSALIAFGLLAGRHLEGTNNWALVVFLVMSLLTVGTVGSTPGKRLLRLRVVSLDGLGKLPVWRAAVRTVLLGLAIPALIWDRDNRGLHDRLSGSVQIRT
ncbi:RDD family protein [Streptomyces sp. 891-h]|uniref:RDD family protein n=1 Tax=unclassified Streptomyces TaxID=2593676 RepID=UPI001FAB3203|nr:RDD family protein [Streptomyces sp. 891-h]UNZ19670.1 RDD family protein [Streptomyces sp. 891-h]